MLTFTLLMAGAAALEVTYGKIRSKFRQTIDFLGKTKQCFVCGQGDFFDFGNDNDACAKVILEEHLRHGSKNGHFARFFENFSNNRAPYVLFS